MEYIGENKDTIIKNKEQKLDLRTSKITITFKEQLGDKFRTYTAGIAYEPIFDYLIERIKKEMYGKKTKKALKVKQLGST